MIISHNCDDNLPIPGVGYVDFFSFESSADDFENQGFELTEVECIDENGDGIQPPAEAENLIYDYILGEKFDYFMDKLCGY